MKTKRNKNAAFNRLIEEMYGLTFSENRLEDCMSLNPDIVCYVPLRYRIIALGFIQHSTLEDLNNSLVEQRCLKLYSRSFWEATLIFAFTRGLSYEDWKRLQNQCQDLYTREKRSSWFSDRKLTYQALKSYVLDNSVLEGNTLFTQHQTYIMDKELQDLDDVDALRQFLSANIQHFSDIREKTRYYFCKYLYYWLNRRIERYLTACEIGKGVDETLSDLLCFKTVALLRRNPNMSKDKKIISVEQAPLSCSEIFDAFSYFFFGYVSVDWIEALLECYASIEDIPLQHKHSLAQMCRKKHPEWKKLTDDQVIQQRLNEEEEKEDASYSRNGNRGYGKNREGERALFKYILGDIDIDRTVFICFLLFFASDASMPDNHKLTVARLNDILLQCGFATLEIEDDIDWFLTELLENHNSKTFLTNVISDYAKKHKNSFLYRIYRHSKKNENELLHIMFSDSELMR